jgi:hypothetical protein
MMLFRTTLFSVLLLAIALPLLINAEITLERPIRMHASVQRGGLSDGSFIIDLSLRNAALQNGSTQLLRANDPSGNAWGMRMPLTPDQGSFRDEDVRECQVYYYRTRTTTDEHELWSNMARAQSINFPIDLSAIRVSPEAIAIRWTDTSLCERGYVVERAKVMSRLIDTEWVEVAYVGENTQGYIDTLIQPDADYVYRVRAFGGPVANRYYSLYSDPVLIR